jgi:hypothetical protein
MCWRKKRYGAANFNPTIDSHPVEDVRIDRDHG